MWSNISILIQAPIFNVQLLLNGLMVGAIFALAAYGLALVWGVMNVKNLAQGEFVIMGGYIAYYLSVDDIVWIGIPGTGITFIEFLKPAIHPLWAIPVAIPVMFGFGWFIYRVIISKVIDRDLFTSLLATFGLAIVLPGGAVKLIGLYAGLTIAYSLGLKRVAILDVMIIAVGFVRLDRSPFKAIRKLVQKSLADHSTALLR